MEDLVPFVLEAEEAFYDRRTAGDPIVRLMDVDFDEFYFGPDDVTRVDHFPHPYMGRVYPEGRGNEIVSMGLQEMYLHPREFASADPDYFDFIWNTLRGKIHEPDRLFYKVKEQ